MQILRNYYGDDIEIVVDAPVQDLGDSYPGQPLRLGDIGENVFRVQVALNRISQNYPAIPKISPVNGIFDEQVEDAVRQFQRIFNLTPDGVVGKATWYKMVYLYVGVTRLGELVSEGQQYRRIGFQYPGVLRQSDSGEGVRTLQYMLAVLAQFNAALEPLTVDGVYGAGTTRAVEAFQHFAGLEPDGVAGEQTWNAIYRSYIGIGNYLARDRVRFPDNEVATAGGQQNSFDFSRTARLGQFPGFSMEFGRGDGGDGQKGMVMV